MNTIQFLCNLASILCTLSVLPSIIRLAKWYKDYKGSIMHTILDVTSSVLFLAMDGLLGAWIGFSSSCVYTAFAIAELMLLVKYNKLWTLKGVFGLV